MLCRDPNLPVKWIDDPVSEWQQFSADGESRFLEINDAMRMVETPNRDKLERLNNALKPVLRRRYHKLRKSASGNTDGMKTSHFTRRERVISESAHVLNVDSIMCFTLKSKHMQTCRSH